MVSNITHAKIVRAIAVSCEREAYLVLVKRFMEELRN